MVRKIEFATSEGEMQTKLEAATDHLYIVWGEVHKLMGVKLDKEDSTPLFMRPYHPNDPRYPLAALHRYIYEVTQGMYQQWGSTDGQLCPYKDCAYNLAFSKSGWWTCGNCLRHFYARVSDSDMEDFHCKCDGGNLPEKPNHIPIARVLGKSWASPD